MTEYAHRWQDWEKEIRAPAEKTKEGWRKLDCGSATALPARLHGVR